MKLQHPHGPKERGVSNCEPCSKQDFPDTFKSLLQNIGKVFLLSYAWHLGFNSMIQQSNIYLNANVQERQDLSHVQLILIWHIQFKNND